MLACLCRTLGVAMRGGCRTLRVVCVRCVCVVGLLVPTAATSRGGWSRESGMCVRGAWRVGVHRAGDVPCAGLAGYG
eukprot:4366119-Prymnesium_polylepis.1